ncbi:unnamed protein product [Rodentolepis nana]|uniref:Uncharacterized protein n=1 Tax=Rodentolepis nana TaxID=102285 RepID=A0A0R3TJY5_RODNA|nr:unnamed protein product [Rodentolepis nana]
MQYEYASTRPTSTQNPITLFVAFYLENPELFHVDVTRGFESDILLSPGSDMEEREPVTLIPPAASPLDTKDLKTQNIADHPPDLCRTVPGEETLIRGQREIIQILRSIDANLRRLVSNS